MAINRFGDFEIIEATKAEMAIARELGKCVSGEGFRAYNYNGKIYVDDFKPLREALDNRSESK